MKVILICFPRTGSTAISYYYEMVNTHFKVFKEPFNWVTKYRPYFSYNSVVNHTDIFVKHHYGQIPLEFNELPSKEFYDKIFIDFDKVVFLDRKDTKTQAESLAYAEYFDRWHTNYVYQNIPEDDVNWKIKTLKELKSGFYDLLESTDSKLYYYEDIFQNKELMKEFLSDICVEFDEKHYNLYLDYSKKYRKEKIIKGII